MACSIAMVIIALVIVTILLLFLRDDKKEGFSGGRGRGGWSYRGNPGRGYFNPGYWGGWANYWPGYTSWSYPSYSLSPYPSYQIISENGGSSCLQGCNESYRACANACGGNSTCLSACQTGKLTCKDKC